MSAKKSHELKQLKSQHAEAIAKFNAANDGAKAKQKEAALHKQHVDNLQARIKALETNGGRPILTEHALLRYFERVLGFDLEAISSQLVTDEIATTVNEMVSGKVPGKDCRLVFKDRVIVTLEAA